jgi:hypothetical protein
MTPALNLIVVLSIAMVTLCGPLWASTSSGSLPKGTEVSSSGCCSGAGANELEINVLESQLNNMALVGNEFQATHSVVFAPATVLPAPNGPDVKVWHDDARPIECDPNNLRQWSFSGEPHFPLAGDGDEVLQFLDINNEPMAVSKITISIGFNNGIGTTTLKAFDCSGNLLEEQPNAIEGFQDMEIDRFGENEIHYIVVEAPQDAQGVGINCIRFPTPAPCDIVSVEESAWGAMKTLYR